MTRTSVALVGLTLTAGVAQAHPMRFGVLDVHVRGDDVDLTLQFSGSNEEPRGLALRVTPVCEERAPETFARLASGERRTLRLRCPGGRGDRTLEVGGLARTEAQVLVRLPDGSTVTLDPGAPTVALAPPGEPVSTLGTHFALGAKHILEGLDHLAFVLALLLLVGLRARLLAVITAFTVGHSLTLALASLSLVEVDSRTTEALIALSVVWLALELVRDPDATPTWTRTHPGMVAALFGLLHGLGFAGALRNVGLPEDAIVPALFGFNLGVEAGQLVFVGGAGALLLAFRRVARRSPRLALFVPYVLGTVAMTWTLERVFFA